MQGFVEANIIRGSESKPISKFGGMCDSYSDFGRFFGLFSDVIKRE